MSNLSVKVGFYLLLAFVAIFGSQILSRSFLEIPALHVLEQQAIARDVQRLRNAINQNIEFLTNYSCDVAVWDQAYAHMQVHDPDYIEVNFDPNSLETYGIDWSLIVSLDGKVTHAASRAGLQAESAITKQKLAEQPAGIEALVTSFADDFHSQQNQGVAGGAIAPILLGSCPVLPDSGEGDSRGSLVNIRYADAQFIQELTEATQLAFELIDISKLLESDKYYQVSQQLMAKHRGESLQLGESVFWLLDSLSDNTQLMVVLPVTHNFENTRPLYLSSYISMGFTVFIFVVLGIYFIRELISPIQDVTRHIKRIRKTDDYSLRMGSLRKDEIGQLSQEYDNLLAHIARQEKALVTANQELKDLSNIDPLTNIYNRRYFDEYMSSSWQQAIQTQTPLAVCLCDIDFFKLYNDNYGHQAGDSVLQRVASAMRSNIHSGTDCIARYGGEEFIVLLTATSLDDAKSVAENLCKAISAMAISHEYSACADVVTASIGVAGITPTASDNMQQDMKKLIERADEALYQTKESGRNGVTLFV